jgi:hypothetical protein
MKAIEGIDDTTAEFIKGVDDCNDVNYMRSMQKLYAFQSRYIETVLLRDEKNTHKYVLDVLRKVAKSLL